MSIDRNEIERTRERRSRLARELVDEMTDAVDLLGSMSREVAAANGRVYRLTIEEVSTSLLSDEVSSE